MVVKIVRESLKITETLRFRDYTTIGGGNSNIFLFSPRTLGKMNPFWRAYIFQMGWFNHQLENDLHPQGKPIYFQPFYRGYNSRPL